jgi:glycosyltransferase involved in cell wall biosynthesis
MKVSIIIPCYNVDDCIQEAIDCAKAQSHPSVEIICIDNGSTDRTLDILESSAEKGDILLLKQPKKGASAARNMGWRAASGDWIQFLDADDLIGPEKIQHQIELLKASDSNPSFIAGSCCKVDPTDGSIKVWPVKEPIWQGLLTNSAGNSCANLFRRSALESVGGRNEELKSSQGYDLMFRLMQKEEFVLVDQDSTHTTIRTRAQGSISTADKWGNQERFLALMARICDFLRMERPAVYQGLPDDWFQQMYQRIRLNTVHGRSGSVGFYRSILPDGFVPAQRPYDGNWFRLTMSWFGFPLADRIHSFMIRLRGG